VTSTNDSGAGTLRQALLEANNLSATPRIVFAIPGPGPHTIRPLSRLPPIREPLVLDGWSQPGFSGQPRIQLNGASAGAVDGLLILAGGTTVRGLAIHAFQRDGIRIEGEGGNIIQGNFIGTDSTGSLSLSNGVGGITILESSGNLIGGTNAGERNLISGRNSTGIYISGGSSSNNVIQGNFIGTDVTGTNALGNRVNGILISDAPDNLIGGTVPGARNIISGNGQSGVYLLGTGSVRNGIAGNFIGTDLTGTRALSNRVDGVTLFRAGGNVIGGSVAAARNLISGNGERGIFINGAGATNNFIQGNFIGSDVTGRMLLGNRFSGVGIVAVAGSVIGGTVPGAGNLISGNQQSGISISDPGTGGTRIEGNLIGVDATGTNALPNSLNGVVITGASGNVVGGSVMEARNIISGNGHHGVFLANAGAAQNEIRGNLIGTDPGGRLKLGNSFCGIRVEGPGNMIGGPNAAERNLISDNRQLGIYLFGAAASNNVVQGNFIGTDAAGALNLGNALGGIGITGAPGNLIGGITPGARNLISANRESGIYLEHAGARGNVIRGNYIGTDVTGTLAQGNTYDGISLYNAPSNVIGGATPGAGNLISANQWNGIYLARSGTTNNLIQGNWIGTQAGGVLPRGNREHGIELDESASHNVIGGTEPGAGNVIASAIAFGYDGVRVRDGSTGIRIRGNSIFSNSGLGIDLGVDGVTPNDLGDVDAGANQLQNFPLMVGVTNSTFTWIGVTLHSRPFLLYTIDFYANAACDPSGHGEGQTWLAERVVRTDASGNASFLAVLPHLGPVAPWITATATDEAGNTSEFSPCAQAVSMADSDGDGLPDVYELAHGLNPFDPSDAGGDLDQDGFTNLQEYLAGTDPRSSASLLEITSVELMHGGWRISFQSVSGKTYRVEHGADPVGPWEVFADFISGTGSVVTVVDKNGGEAGRRFYRVRLVQ
jgi:hypothetical protein